MVNFDRAWLDCKLYRPLNARQYRCHIVCGAPAVLKDVKAQFTGTVNVRVEHLADELHCRRLVGILFFEIHNESKGPIFERGIHRSDNDSVPVIAWQSK